MLLTGTTGGKSYGYGGSFPEKKIKSEKQNEHGGNIAPAKGNQAWQLISLDTDGHRKKRTREGRKWP